MPNQYDTPEITQEQVLSVLSSEWKTIEDIMNNLNLCGRKSYKAVTFRMMRLIQKNKAKGYYYKPCTTRRQKYILVKTNE